jgi:hypothetical protein
MGGAANMATPNRAGKHGKRGVVGEVQPVSLIKLDARARG